MKKAKDKINDPVIEDYEFLFQEYGLCPDRELTLNAIELKNKMLKSFTKLKELEQTNEQE